MRHPAALAAGAAVLLAGCASHTNAGSTPLSWKGTPLVFRATHLPRDRILIGTIRNRSKRSLRLAAGQVTVRDVAGHRLRGSAQFKTAYAHGLYGAYQKPTPLPPEELVRLGLVVEVPAGSSAPLAITFRLGPSTRPPLHVEYGRGSLPVPANSRRPTQ